MSDPSLTTAELVAADNRPDRELTLGEERFRGDREPRLTLCTEHVVGVKILVDEDLRPLRPGQLVQYLDGGVEESTLEGLGSERPDTRQVILPPRRLLRERRERRTGGPPQSPQQ